MANKNKISKTKALYLIQSQLDTLEMKIDDIEYKVESIQHRKRFNLSNTQFNKLILAIMAGCTIAGTIKYLFY